MMNHIQLNDYLSKLLSVDQFLDYCPNGLQVEGKQAIRKIGLAVTASLNICQKAAKAGVDALLVHHGWFWKSDDPRVVGWRKARLEILLSNQINLYAYHLPLDAHPVFGNNAQLALKMGWQIRQTTAEQNILFLGCLPSKMGPIQLQKNLAIVLGRQPLVLGPAQKEIVNIAWCTGAAQSFFQQGIDAGVDAFISGEVSEQTTHLANETGTVYFAAGHHATEKFGVQALGAYLSEKYALETIFLDENNPV